MPFTALKLRLSRLRPVQGALISFPKSGRTWVRVMLDELGVRLKYSHAGSGHNNPVAFEALTLDKARGRRPLVFLYRDPLDTVVSGYHQATKRVGAYEGPISAFIRDPLHGVEKIACFNLMWLEEAGRRPRSASLSYEALRAEPEALLARLVTFCGGQADPGAIAEAVERNRFEAMRRREASGELGALYGDILKPADGGDNDSFKVRRGKIGGYADELSADDVAWAESRLSALDYRGRVAALAAASAL